MNTTLEIQGVAQGGLVVRTRGREGLSRLYRFAVEFAHPSSALAPENIVGASALLTLRWKRGERLIHGVVRRFDLGHRSRRYALYDVVLAPLMWQLTRRKDCRIFQRLTAPRIIEKVFEESGVPSSVYRFDLSASPPEREYCVQYRETAWSFVSRLLEEEGISYWFDHSASQHVLVMTDKMATPRPLRGGAEVPFRLGQGQSENEEVIQAFEARRRVRPGRFTVTDYDFLNPKRSLLVNASGNTNPELEVYDHPGGHRERAEGEHLASLLLEASEVHRRDAAGEGTCVRLAPGATFDLKEHPRQELNRSWRVTALEHRVEQADVLGAEDAARSLGYTNEFRCIPADVPFRPSRRHHKPAIAGIQLAVVVGPQGEEIHTDPHGRVRVQFHWDRVGRRNENSSCWVRVSQQWAGPGYGAMCVPRIGHEVIISFIEGDPDRPVVTGRLYHAENRPPHELPDHKTWSTIRTRSVPGGNGHNELSLIDAAGQEMIKMHGHKDLCIEIGNDATEQVQRDVTSRVGRHHKVDVQENETLTVGGDRSLKVTGNHEETVQGSRTISVQGAIKIQSQQKIELACGPGKITIDSSGRVAIEGTMIELVGNGVVKINGTLVQLNC